MTYDAFYFSLVFTLYNELDLREKTDLFLCHLAMLASHIEILDQWCLRKLLGIQCIHVWNDDSRPSNHTFRTSTTFLPVATHCTNARRNRCQDLNSFSLEELKQTTLVLRGWDYPVSIRIWNPITTTWMKQLTWLRFVHFGDWSTFGATCY